jgi:hypothetical protein
MRTAGGKVLGGLLLAWLRRVARTASLQVVEVDRALGGDSTCAGLAARLVGETTRGHVIVPFWSAYQAAVPLLATERFGTRPLAEHYEVVADDSVGGEMMHRVGDGLGVQVRSIHANGNPRRLEDVGRWMRDPAPFFIAVDGGRVHGKHAYRTVPTGIIRLAARLRSTLWPLAVHARPFVRCPGFVAEIPLVRAAITVGVAPPFIVERSIPVQAAADELKRRLDRASEAARAGRAARRGATRDSQWRRTG